MQYTRDNEGLANALKKTGGSIFGSWLKSASAPETSHMMFGPSVEGFWAGVFATHPPIEKRIFKPTPRWDGEFIIPQTVTPQENELHPPQTTTDNPSNLATVTAASLAVAIHAIGQPKAEHIKYARQLMHSLPDKLAQVIHDQGQFQFVLMALMLDEKPEVLKKQCDIIKASCPSAALPKVLELHEALENARLLNDRLSILDITLPILKNSPPKQQASLQSILLKLAQADGKISMIEWALMAVIEHSLAQHKRPTGTVQYEKYRHLNSLRGEVSLLIKIMVSMSDMSKEEKQRCFKSTLSTLGLTLNGSSSKASFSALNKALEKIALLYGDAKQQLLEALCTCIEHDGEVTIEEVQVLRAIALAIECPVPPLLTYSSQKAVS